MPNTFPACCGNCNQGDRICTTPEACQLPEPGVFHRNPLQAVVNGWHLLTPAGRFWIGYFGGMGAFAAVLLGVHIFARF